MSALHGRGAGDLLDRLLTLLPGGARRCPRSPTRSPRPSRETGRGRVFSVALVGRPNVGKSTLFNRLIGEDRAVVHDLPGTTRDTIDTVVDTPDGPIRFVDTAGMRRKAKIDEGTEYYSLVRALQAVDGSDVALLVIDATVGITAQDQRLAERIDAAGSPVVVLLNKWELLDAEQRSDVPYQVAERLHFIGEAPVLKLSALTGKGVHKLLPALSLSIEDYHRRVPTGRVNEVIRAAQQAQPAPHGVKVLYATQAAVDPPDLHAVLEPRGAADLPALPRAHAPGGLRPRGHADEAPRPQALELDLQRWGPVGGASGERASAALLALAAGRGRGLQHADPHQRGAGHAGQRPALRRGVDRAGSSGRDGKPVAGLSIAVIETHTGFVLGRALEAVFTLGLSCVASPADCPGAAAPGRLGRHRCSGPLLPHAAQGVPTRVPDRRGLDRFGRAGPRRSGEVTGPSSSYELSVATAVQQAPGPAAVGRRPRRSCRSVPSCGSTSRRSPARPARSARPPACGS